MAARRRRLGEWTPEEVISGGLESSSEVDAAALPDGGIVAAWQCVSKKKAGIWLAKNLGEGWSEPERVSPEGQVCYRPSVAADEKGRTWVAWDCFADGRWRVLAKQAGKDEVFEVPTLSGSKGSCQRVRRGCAKASRQGLSFMREGKNDGKNGEGCKAVCVAER